MKKIVRTVKMGINGEAIGYINKKPVFIDGCLPEELVEIDYVQNNQKFFKTKAIKILKKSNSRIKADCEYQRKCSCPLMVMDYEKQLVYKKMLLEEALFKYAAIQKDKIDEVVRADKLFNYRNQCKLPVGYKGYLFSGLYMPESNILFDVEYCLLHDKKIENVRRDIIKLLRKHKVKSYDFKTKKGLRYLVIRCFDDKCQVTFVTGNDEYDKLFIDEVLKVDGVVSLYQNINIFKAKAEIFGANEKLLKGEKYLRFVFNGLKVSLLPKAFFQLNTLQAVKLYELVKSLVKSCENLVEAYCGVGIMSLMLKYKAKRIVGIESVKDAIDNAKLNAKDNNIDNVEFICDDAAKALIKIKKVDCLVVDPPRSGLNDEMINVIIDKKIEQVVYVSCNPATLGKNLNILKRYYKIKKIIPIDMFSHTAHCECVAVLQRVK